MEKKLKKKKTHSMRSPKKVNDSVLAIKAKPKKQALGNCLSIRLKTFSFEFTPFRMFQKSIYMRKWNMRKEYKNFF